MTAIQNDYNKLVETQRHNAADESLTNKDIVQRRNLEQAKLKEAKRHNEATEHLDKLKLGKDALLGKKGLMDLGSILKPIK